MSATEVLLLLLAGVGAGLVGTVAGLASLVSYPALLAAGIPALAANVTNTVALVLSGVGAAAGSQQELRGQSGNMRRYLPVAACGGVAGSALLLLTGSATFEVVVPWLVAGASLLLLAQPRLQRLRTGRLAEHRWALRLAVFAVAVYGGYFGAAAGVLMLALLAVGLGETLLRANALKNMAVMVSNAVAALGFAVFGPVRWTAALPLAAGFLVGGWLGPKVARRLPTRLLRVGIAIAGLGLAVRLWVMAYR